MVDATGIQIGLKVILSTEFKKIWDNFSTGIFVTDEKSRALYMNPAQEAIDHIRSEQILGKRVTEVYAADDEFSLTAQCIKERRTIRNHTYCYYVNRDNMVMSVSTIFPLFQGSRLTGTICFVNSVAMSQKTYNSLAMDFEKRLGKKKKKNYGFQDIIGDEYEFKQVIKKARRSAETDSPVMIWGESGVGKELFAQAIHEEGPRKNAPFVPINCAAIPEALLEGLLFGTAKGAFTGAVEKTGLLESAHTGTVLLDELNSMPLPLQAKLLRVLQEKKVRRVGAITETPVDVRIISTLNVNPKKALAGGGLRKDLFYRLGVVILKVPPLRRRKLDIPLLCPVLLKKHRRLSGRKVYIDDRVYTRFFNYHWPGNVRELEHVVEGALNIMGSGNRIMTKHVRDYFTEKYEEDRGPSSASQPSNQTPEDMASLLELGQKVLEQQLAITQTMARNLSTPPRTPHHPMPDPGTDGFCGPEYQPPAQGEPLKAYLERMEAAYIRSTLEKTDRNVSKSARLLDISPQNLHHKIKKYGF